MPGDICRHTWIGIAGKNQKISLRGWLHKGVSG
jgi:hypothetical protein